MSGDVAVLWLDDGSAREAAAHALDEWARAHGVQLAPVRPATGPVRDLAVGDRVEGELDRARESLAAADGEATDQALARAEALLRDHPELPQAAWLRAEVTRAWAARWLRLTPRDEARARSAWEDAQALDDGRAPGIGELASAARPKAHVSFVVHVHSRAAARLVLRVDGKTIPGKASAADTLAFEADLVPAEHQVVASLDGRLLHAAWKATSDVPIELDIVDGGACSAEDLGGAHRDETGRIKAAGVACDQWLAVQPGTSAESVLVAQCTGDTCGPLAEWHIEHAAVRPPPQARREQKHWPAWATWTLVGVGAAGATVLGIVASGALQSRATEQRFTVGGLRQE